MTALEPYQSLPELAARRAEAQARLASRQIRPEPVTEPTEPTASAAASPETESRLKPLTASVEPATIYFAHEAPVRAAAGGKPPVHLAAVAPVERGASRTRTPTRPALAVARTAPNSAMRPAIAKTPIESKEPDRLPIRLASAAPLFKSKGAVEDRRVSIATGKGNGRLNPVGAVAERRDARPSNGHLIESAPRDSRKKSSSAGRQEARKAANDPSVAKPAIVRLASLKMNRSRIATD